MASTKCSDYLCDPSGRFCVSKSSIHDLTQSLYDKVAARDPNEKEFLQAFKEVLFSLIPLFEKDPWYLTVMETIAEPEQVHTFRVAWIDDSGVQRVNRGYRVQYSSALGPYKGGLRYHPTVNLSVIKFLGFEQIFKNSLTGLQLGGGKGGSDFDPKGRSELEILRFCQSFAVGLAEHIGPNMDVPAGDVGVGGRELGYLFGMYKRLKHQFEGAFTGKNPKWGGSNLRPEATGYGVVYFAKHMLEANDDTLEGKRCIVSGSGNVAQYCAEKLWEEGAKVLTLSDSNGYVYMEDGLTREMLCQVIEIKQVKRGRIKELADAFPNQVKYIESKKPWEVKADVAFPCATQNEITKDDAEALVKNKVLAVVEGANMPSTAEAYEVFKSNSILFGPAKAANAGGVAVSGLEMSQNSTRLQWSREEVDKKLKEIMANIFEKCAHTAEKYGCKNDYVTGANIAAFLKVADSVMEQGCV